MDELPNPGSTPGFLFDGPEDAPISGTEDAARSKRVTDAMLKMVKLDAAALERAARS